MINTFATVADSDLNLLWSLLRRVAANPLAAGLELLLIGSVVYTILRFLHGTRGARLVRAVLLILVVSSALVLLITRRFGLERINVLYPYFILAVFLVSLVAFQTELRRMLLRVGERTLLGRWVKAENLPIHAIVTATENLANRKFGALIAIERTTEIGAVTETGVRLDAQVSAELLETIFRPGTPLHDLGVIIRKSRILAAGCQFPLAESGEIDRALGSRHRAAVGMCHEADAVVVVVSEETGAISIAVGGKLERAVSVEQLRRTLYRECGQRQYEDSDGEADEDTAESTRPAKADRAAAGTHALNANHGPPVTKDETRKAVSKAAGRPSHTNATPEPSTETPHGKRELA